MEHFLTILSNIIVKKFFRPIARRFSSLKSPAVAAISHAFPRLRLPRKTSADAPPVRLSPARSAKKTQPLSDCVFFKWRDGLRVELDCAALALSGFCVAKIPFASRLSAPQKTQPFRIAFFSSGGMGFASNWTALRLPYRVFARQKSRSPLTFPRHKKRNPFGLRFLQSGGMDETRTRDLLRDRQAF